MTDTVSGMWRGWYLDGVTPRRRAAEVAVYEHGLRITTEDGLVRLWPFTDFRQTQGFYPGEATRLERGDENADVLVLDEPGVARVLRGLGGARGRGVRAPVRRSARALVVAGSTLLALVLAVAMYRWGVPGVAALVTAAVPVRWEEQLGEQSFAMISGVGRLCTDPRLEAALADITARLTAVAPKTPYRLRVVVLDVPDVNAIALPGGRIVVFRGLLALTDSPEMLAGVLGHEFQHVLHRHATRALVRQAAISGLISALTQDARWIASALGSASFFSALQYSRAAEEEADRDGLRMLRAAGIDQRGMIAFFTKIAVDEEATRDRSALWRLLETHPRAESRVDVLTALAAREATRPAPLALSGAWDETRTLCGEP